MKAKQIILLFFALWIPGMIILYFTGILTEDTEGKYRRDWAMRDAMIATDVVQENYLFLQEKLKSAVQFSNEEYFNDAKDYDKSLHSVFKMMDIYSDSLDQKKIYEKYGERDSVFKNDTPNRWEIKSPGSLADLKNWTNPQIIEESKKKILLPFNQLEPIEDYNWDYKSDVFFIAKYLNDSNFKKHPDHVMVESRFNEIRVAFEKNQIDFVQFRTKFKTNLDIWKPDLLQIAKRMESSYFKELPDNLMLSGSEKWSIWDISDKENYNNSFDYIIPEQSSAIEPSENTLFFVIYKRTDDKVGEYIPVGYGNSNYAPKYAATLEHVFVVVGTIKPFKIFGIRELICQDNLPETISTNGFHGDVKGEQIEKLFYEVSKLHK